MKQGDIILVPFPFTDLSSHKTRPALVVSKRLNGDDIIAAAITSKTAGRSVLITNESLEHGELPITSYVRYDKIVTLHTALVRKTVATLKPIPLRKVIFKLKNLL